MCCYGYNTIWYPLELAVINAAYRQLQTTEKLNAGHELTVVNHNHNRIGIINKLRISIICAKYGSTLKASVSLLNGKRYIFAQQTNMLCLACVVPGHKC